MTTVNAVYPVDILIPNTWREPVLYRLHESLTIVGVTIPKGFTTDGSSSPRLLWFLFPPVCRYFPAAAVHDFLLESGVSWKIANRHFRRALKEHNIRPWRKKLMSVGVAIYGWYKELGSK